MQYICIVEDKEYTALPTRYAGARATLYGRGEAVAVSRSASLSNAGGTSCLGKDLLGSVRSATGETGQLEERYEYDAFGQPYAGDLESGMNLGYTGKPYDSATGLYNFGYRDYAPVAARFTTVDPVRDGNNWFTYVNNDPVNWVDPWGLSANDNYEDYPYAGIAPVLVFIALPSPIPQIPDDPSDYHCDINAYNNALEHGKDPRGQNGQAWDGNAVSVPEIFAEYPNDRHDAPPPNTSGYAFHDPSHSGNPSHMIFYERGDGDSYTAHQSDGKEPTTPTEWSIGGTFVRGSTFVPLPDL
jgi:RHS repeat-associated protein